MSLNKYIDHTLLKPDSTKEQIITICEEAKKYDFAAVCVNSTYVKLASNELSSSDVKVCTVVGFPLGASPKEVKALEAKLAIDNGASEIDMVLNIGALKSKEFESVKEDISHVAKTCHDNNAILKVILETCLLTNEEISLASKICVEAQADFVKTSTGFSHAGANLEVVKIMKQAIGDKALIKAAGGVKTPEDAYEMIKYGANRIGTSSGVKLMSGDSVNSGY